MRIAFDLTLDDVIAFNRYHHRHNARCRRFKHIQIFSLPIAVGAFSFLLPTNDEWSRTEMAIAGWSFAAFIAIVTAVTYQWWLDDQVRALYAAGTNRGLFGRHELIIEPEFFTSRTEVSESRQRWAAVEKFVLTPDYAFLYTGSQLAHIIPRKAIIEGDAEELLIKTKEYWLASKLNEKVK